MDLLQLLTDILSDLGGLNGFGGVIDYLKQNDFDIKKIISNLDFEKLSPIIAALSNIKGPENKISEPARFLSPISSIADKDIVFALNRYFA